METLSCADLDGLARLGIPEELLNEAHVVRVSDREARDKYGIRGSPTKDMSGIVFPYFIPQLEYPPTARLRRDHPEFEDGKPKNKYISPYGCARHLYFPPGCKELLKQPEVPVVLVEAEKSVLAITAWSRRTGIKVIALGMGGCWGWRGRIGKTEDAKGQRVDVTGPLPDLRYCKGHEVVALLDANASTNSRVQTARKALIQALHNLGCGFAKTPDLPDMDGKVNGPDDFIGTCGDEAFKEILFGDHSSRSNEAARLIGYSDDALALTFTAEHEDLRYVAVWGRWMMWNGHVWIPDATCNVINHARAICRAQSERCDLVVLARKIRSAPTVMAVERLARADRRHAAEVKQWDADPWLLNTPDGIVDLRTGRVHPARRENYMTKITAVGPGDRRELWQGCLERITNNNRALIAFIQRACGYVLTGVTREDAIFFFYGTGGNGKTVFLNTIAGIMGDYAKSAPIETFIASRKEQHPTELAWLQGARLVTAVETEDGRRWSESKLKQITGGDPIAARYMRQDFFEYAPQFKLFFAGNHKPGLRNVDEAMRRRLNLLPFTVTIPESERDRDLKEKLRGEWPGILQWAIEGCLAWQAEGLNAPEVVTGATADYLAAEDVMARWLEDRCQIIQSAWETVSALFADWRRWTEANGEFTGSEKRFSQNLESRGFIRQRTGTARRFQGIALRDSRLMTVGSDSLDIDVPDARTHKRTNGADSSEKLRL
jgi:putative DNA primase/helicase